MLEMAVHYSESMVRDRQVSTYDGEKRAAVTDYLVDVVANPNLINDARLELVLQVYVTEA